MKLPFEDAVLFAGASHPKLASSIAESLGVSLGSIDKAIFPDGETFLEIMESVRGKQAFFVQSVAHRPNDYLMELLIAADALKRASAREIIAVVPYFGYCRQDRRNHPREPITAKLVADLLTKAGVTHLITMDLHAQQVEGFFNIPVDNLSARMLISEAIKRDGLEPGIIVAPDVGSIKIARGFSKELGVDFAVIDKHRLSPSSVEVRVIGDVKGKDVLLADDICSTGSTLVSAAKACHEKGAKRIFAAVTHWLLKDVEAIAKSPIDVIYVADTIELNESAKALKLLRLVPTASLFGQAIDCTISNKSIVSLFQKGNLS